MEIKEEIVNWLLEDSNPSIRYRTLTEIQDISLTKAEIKNEIEKILKSPVALKIINNMHPDGYWEEKIRDGRLFGSGVDYYGYSSTHFVLSYLAELGLTRKELFIEKAANRYLSLQQPDGDFLKHLSCMYGLNIRTFLKLGFQEDKRLKKTINLMKTQIRHDNGFLCELHEGKRKKRPVKSCYRGTVKVLFAVSELPHLWQEDYVKRLVNYFLKREILFKTTNMNEVVRGEATGIIFPFSWRSGLLEILYSLSKMGYGKDQRLNRAWNILEKHQLEDGKYKLHWTPSNLKYLIPGKKMKENKWATFYAYLCLKYKNS